MKKLDLTKAANLKTAYERVIDLAKTDYTENNFTEEGELIKPLKRKKSISTQINVTSRCRQQGTLLQQVYFDTLQTLHQDKSLNSIDFITEDEED